MEDKKVIPKIIHYCWFGGNDLSELAKKCISSWRKYCPDYEIIEWNESNFDINLCQYVREAYKEKKWAFVSDYARFWILYNFGGIYMDTDVELIKSIDDLVEYGSYMGCEPTLQDMDTKEKLRKMRFVVNPGLGLAAPKHHPFFYEILECYNKKSFYKDSGELDLTTVVHTTTLLLNKYGFEGGNTVCKIAGMNIYPAEYFCPKDYLTGKIHMTVNTHSIHHYTASWQSDKGKKQWENLQKCNSIFGNKVGYKIWRIYTLPSRIQNKIQILGMMGMIRFAFKKIKDKLLWKK